MSDYDYDFDDDELNAWEDKVLNTAESPSFSIIPPLKSEKKKSQAKTRNQQKFRSGLSWPPYPMKPN